tara:strand:+ start:362 stop:823 length:462 start_codon:yes stop_codon:yes gene_type:complete
VGANAARLINAAGFLDFRGFWCYDWRIRSLVRIRKMIGQIVSAVGGLASSYIDGKTAVQKANAEIKLKQATGEIDWDLAAIQATENSWKDEWITLLFSIPLILAFMGDWGNDIVQRGFTALETMPLWYQYSLGGIVSASIGIRSVSKFFGGKK